MAGLRRLPAAGALLSLAGFLTARLYLEVALRSDGAKPGGTLQYDSFYPLSFARELAREHHLFLFHNPFGSADRHAGLFDGLATLLRVALPLWNDHLTAFDIAVGALASLAAGWFFGVVVARVARCRPATAYFVVALTVFGGGVAFLLRDRGILDSPQLLATAYWGPTWITNSIATWELCYHALFWGGVAALLAGRRVVPILVAAVLAFLHPFSVAMFALVCLVVFLSARGRTERIEAVPVAVAGTVAIAVVGTLVYEVVLPRTSGDAAFFKATYERIHFSVPTSTLLLFLAFPLGLLVVRTMLAPPPRRLRPPREAVAFAAAAVVLLAISASAAVTKDVPQPAHWIRVYPAALLFLAAVATPVRFEPVRFRWLPAAAATTAVVVACADSASTFAEIRSNLRGSPPMALSPGEARLLARLRTLPEGSLAYVRSCRLATPFPGLEYAISSLTPQHIPVGHVFFTPALGRRERPFVACLSSPRGVERIRNHFRYVVLDLGAARSLGVRGGDQVGQFRLLTRSTTPAEAVGGRGDGA